MSLVEADDVPLARSPFSASSTERPRPAASRAIPQPFTPPPMMAMSYIDRAAFSSEPLGASNANHPRPAAFA